MIDIRVGRVLLVVLIAAAIVYGVTHDAIVRAERGERDALPKAGSRYLDHFTLTDHGIVAFGYEATDDSGDSAAGMWFRADGNDTWEPMRLPADAQIEDAVSDRGSLVAVGSTSQGEAGVWRWDDLDSEAVAISPLAASAGGDAPLQSGLTAIARGPSGFVAAGAVWNDDGRVAATALSSTDGLEWRAVDLSGGRGRSQASAVVARGDRFVVFGVQHPSSGDSRVAVWESTAAGSWTERVLPLPGGAPRAGSWVVSAASGPDGLVAVGRHDLRSVVWTYADGSWEVHLVTPPVPRGGGLNAIAAAPDGGWVATGFTFPPGVRYDEVHPPVVLRSDDGAAWTPVATTGAPATASFSEILVEGTGVVLAGSEWDGASAQPLLVPLP